MLERGQNCVESIIQNYWVLSRLFQIAKKQTNKTKQSNYKNKTIVQERKCNHCMIPSLAGNKIYIIIIIIKTIYMDLTRSENVIKICHNKKFVDNVYIWMNKKYSNLIIILKNILLRKKEISRVKYICLLGADKVQEKR